MWHFQGTISKVDARKWGPVWAQLGWGIKLERTQRCMYRIYLRFPSR